MKYIDMLLDCLFGDEPPEPDTIWEGAQAICTAILASLAICLAIYFFRRFPPCGW